MLNIALYLFSDTVTQIANLRGQSFIGAFPHHPCIFINSLIYLSIYIFIYLFIYWGPQSEGLARAPHVWRWGYLLNPSCNCSSVIGHMACLRSCIKTQYLGKQNFIQRIFTQHFGSGFSI